MLKIIGDRGSGKTEQLIEIANANNGIVVCANPQLFIIKARTKGYTNVKFISYNDLISSHRMLDQNIYIDELDEFVNYLTKYYYFDGTPLTFAGFTQTKE